MLLACKHTPARPYWQPSCGDEQLSAVMPSIVAALKRLSIDALLSHQGADALAEMQSLSANEYE